MQDLENHAYQFQSTLPSQGATDLPEGIASVLDISIHAPLTGSDRTFLILNIRGTIFQSTLPSQGATFILGYMLGIQQISIHAPLTGSDYLAIFYVFQNKYFNPRSPHRERR